MSSQNSPATKYEQLNFDNAKYMTIRDDELYWRDKKIKVANRLDLTWGEKISGILLVIGTLAAPCATYFTGLESLCKFTGNKAPFCGIGIGASANQTSVIPALAVPASGTGLSASVSSTAPASTAEGPVSAVNPTATVGASGSAAAGGATKHIPSKKHHLSGQHHQ